MLYFKFVLLVYQFNFLTFFQRRLSVSIAEHEQQQNEHQYYDSSTEMPQNARLPFYGFSNFLSDFKGEINKIKWAKIYN